MTKPSRLNRQACGISHAAAVNGSPMIAAMGRKGVVTSSKLTDRYSDCLEAEEREARRLAEKPSLSKSQPRSGVPILLYLVLGWSGILAYESVVGALPYSTLCLLAIGILYSVGVVFHVWESLRFQNGIWSGFVLIAAVFHYCAVRDCLVLART